jgi:membrane protein YdbS with pleckstrin-like domain
MARYPTKKDAWIVVLVGGAIVALAGVGVVGIATGELVVMTLGLLGSIVIFGVLRLIAFPIVYEVGEDALVIEAGIQRMLIPIERIEKVTPSRNPMSSPAWSLDRLRIDYRSPAGKPKSVLISPLDKAGFLAELEAKRK